MTTANLTLNTNSTVSRRIPVHKGLEPSDWQKHFESLNNSGILLTMCFSTVVGFASITSLLGSFLLIINLLHSAFSDINLFFFAILAIPIAILLGAATGQYTGNIFLALWFSMSNETRRGFALRLTLSKANINWSNFLICWLFTGDWLKNPTLNNKAPYMRVFITGKPPKNCAYEYKIWQDIQQGLGNLSSKIEAELNYYELSYPETLPSWVSQMNYSENFTSLTQYLGKETALDWVNHLWERAYKQWPLLNSQKFPLIGANEVLELHYLTLNGHKALVVILRPYNITEQNSENIFTTQSAAA